MRRYHSGSVRMRGHLTGPRAGSTAEYLSRCENCLRWTTNSDIQIRSRGGNMRTRDCRCWIRKSNPVIMPENLLCVSWTYGTEIKHRIPVWKMSDFANESLLTWEMVAPLSSGSADYQPYEHNGWLPCGPIVIGDIGIDLQQKALISTWWAGFGMKRDHFRWDQKL